MFRPAEALRNWRDQEYPGLLGETNGRLGTSFHEDYFIHFPKDSYFGRTKSIVMHQDTCNGYFLLLLKENNSVIPMIDAKLLLMKGKPHWKP